VKVSHTHQCNVDTYLQAPPLATTRVLQGPHGMVVAATRCDREESQSLVSERTVPEQ
jgi:hypothetical protein